MVNALGYSHNEFLASKAGRLCRGRERWIEPFEDDAPGQNIHRLVVSGALFSDDSARDALRGVAHSGVEPAQLISVLFPRKQLVAFMEDGHPADIPEDAVQVEMYTSHRAGGRIENLSVRWMKTVSGIRELRDVLGAGTETDIIRGFLFLDPGVEVDDDLAQRVFQLVGMGCLDSPPSRFQPMALPVLLEVAKAVLLLHRDKHGSALGVYSREPVKTEGRLESLCDKASALLVPFAIPPMLARWDRALAEMRAIWISEREEDFPVPVSDPPSNWEPRRRKRRGRRGRSDSDTEDEMQVETVSTGASVNEGSLESPDPAQHADPTPPPDPPKPPDLDLSDLSDVLTVEPE